MEWYSRLDRIWTERAALDVLAAILPAGTVPRVQFEDRENYLFAMSCAPDDAVTWKSRLMTSAEDSGPLARRVGQTLRTIHRDSRGQEALAGRLADTSLFDELRVDPYYRTVARVHPDLAPALEGLIASMDLPATARSLVLGDYSPKNILVHAGGLILIDFECAHAGDPAFDIGFCLSHLLLKLVRARGADSYRDVARQFLAGYFADAEAGQDRALSHRAGRHAAACLLARLDGKSPVEYRNELDQKAVRRLARSVLTATGPADCLTLVDGTVRELG
jgi:5-methylthioribose kinase